MSDFVDGWVPLSVRRGRREPFRLVEGIPAHARPGVNEWVLTVLSSVRSDTEELIRFIVSSLRLDFHADRIYELISGLGTDDDRYLDALDLLSAMYPVHAEKLEQELHTAGSAWRVDVEKGGLQRRVPEEAQAAYERALQAQPSSADHLSGAWEHAFGRNPDAGDAWGDAIRAVEAALHPIVTPKSSSSTLGKMKGDLRQAPAGKFVVRAPGDDPMVTLLGMLDAIPYEEGRHGSDPRQATLATARVVVFQATTIVAAVAEGLIEVAGQP